MAEPTRTLPPDGTYTDWRKLIQVKRFDVADSRKALYHVTGGQRLLVLYEAEFRFLAGLCQEELGNIQRAESEIDADKERAADEIVARQGLR